MARPKKDEIKDKWIKFRTNDRLSAEHRARAQQAGLDDTAYYELKCLGVEPKVYYPTPKEEKLGKAIEWLRQVVMELRSLEPMNPKAEERKQSAIEGALLAFRYITEDIYGKQG